MDSCDLVHSIKPEKMNALSRYKLFTNIAKAIQLMEALVAIALISWSSTRLPSAFRFSGEYLLAFASYLMNQHVVFLLGNVIVFLCYVLSRFTDSGNDSGVSGILYNDDLTHRTTIPDPPNPPNPNLFRLQVIEAQTKRKIIETVTEQEMEAVSAIKQAAKQIDRFRRTQSDLKSKISVKPGRELQRSVTERRRMRIASGEVESTMKTIQAVDKLSNEEFRTAIETFISKQQRFLKQQSMV